MNNDFLLPTIDFLLFKDAFPVVGWAMPSKANMAFSDVVRIAHPTEALSIFYSLKMLFQRFSESFIRCFTHQGFHYLAVFKN